VADTLELLRAFRFKVTLIPSAQSPGSLLGTGAFQECTGLDVEMDVHEHLEGGANDAVVHQVGRAKFQPITLRRGMLLTGPGQTNTELWTWFQDIVSGRPVRRYDGFIEVWEQFDRPAATWTFRRGLPQKVVGPQLNAKTGEVAIEELQIAHEGLRLSTGGRT
jgi:phage tail-like protein